jgi:hypothetical protein
MFGKRIRSSYHKRVLEWLIDAGGSVSDIAQALDLRMPHASLALRQLRDSGDILRDDFTGIRGAIHRITQQGRKRLEQDAVACLQTYVKQIPDNKDAIVLDSNGPMLLIGYVNNTPSSLISLPIDPMDYDQYGNYLSIGNVGVRWATIRKSQPKWYDINTYQQVQKQELQSKGTLDDWTENKQYIIIVRAYLFDFEKPWNIAPGTWFSIPKEIPTLPIKLSSGNNVLGNVIGSKYLVSPSFGIHAHLSSKIDVSLAINSLSRGAVLIRDSPTTRLEKRFLPIDCLDYWFKQQHPRMKQNKVDMLAKSVKDFLLGRVTESPTISIHRALIKDFGECKWTEEISNNIDVKGLSENGAKALIEWILSNSSFEFIIEWMWPVSTNKELLERVLSSNLCRMLVTRIGDFSTLSTSTTQLRSLSKLAEVELILSREQSLQLELSRYDGESFSNNVYDVIPKTAAELNEAITGEGWNLSAMSDDSKDYKFREKIWNSLEKYPEGDETWANQIEAKNPLAAWIATPLGSRNSRWVRIGSELPKGWADLLPIDKTTTKDILFSLPNASKEWQTKALDTLSNRYLSNQEQLLEHEELLLDKSVGNWFSVAVLIGSNKLSKDFQSLIQSCIDRWLDSPRQAKKVLPNIFPKVRTLSITQRERLTTFLKASKVHPTNSLLFSWGEFIESLKENKPISVEQSRKFMTLLPFEWWRNQAKNWLQLQLNSSSGRRWLLDNFLPWPALLARPEGEICGPPGYQEIFSQSLPSSDEVLQILILEEGDGKPALLDLYDMVMNLENNQTNSVGRIHPHVGWLARDILEWPDMGIEVLKLGDINVGSLLFARYFNRCLIRSQ